MSSNFIDLLKNVSLQDLESRGSALFEVLIKSMEYHLKIKSFTPKRKILIKDFEIDLDDFLNIGIKRIVNDSIIFTRKFENIFPFLLLREAYYCFIPLELRDNKPIKTIISELSYLFK